MRSQLEEKEQKYISLKKTKTSFLSFTLALFEKGGKQKTKKQNSPKQNWSIPQGSHTAPLLSL